MLSIKRRLESAQQRDGGFTLIELAVVILIIGILLAIAIPTFLGIRRNAQNKAAQSSIRTVLTSAKAKANDEGTYAGMLVPDIAADEKSLTIDANPSTDAKHVSVLVDGDNLLLAAQSQKGVCFVLIDNLAGDTTGTKYLVDKARVDCKPIAGDATATAAKDNIKTGWKV